MIKTTITLLYALGFTLAAPIVSAQTPDPTVQPLLNKVAAAYRNAKMLSFTLEATQFGSLPNSANATYKIFTSKSQVLFRKPDRMTATIVQGNNISHVVCNGTSVFSDTAQDKTVFIKKPYTTFADIVATLTANGGAGLAALSTLLTDPHAEKHMFPELAQTPKRRPDQKVGQDICDVVEALLPNGGKGARLQLCFGKKDHLLRRLSLGDSAVAKPNFVETYTDLNLQPAITEVSFKYTPTTGAKAIDPPKEEALDPDAPPAGEATHKK
jgi:outer membrane lipoprotein-sorting protein